MGFDQYLAKTKNDEVKLNENFENYLNEGVASTAGDVVKNGIKWIRLKSISKKLKKLYMEKAHSQIAVYAAKGKERDKLEKQASISNAKIDDKITLLDTKMTTIADGGYAWFKGAISLAKTNAELDAGDVVIKALKKYKGGTKALDDAITNIKSKKKRKKELVLDLKDDVKKQEEAEKKLSTEDVKNANSEETDDAKSDDAKLKASIEEAEERMAELKAKGKEAASKKDMSAHNAVEKEIAKQSKIIDDLKDKLKNKK